MAHIVFAILQHNAAQDAISELARNSDEHGSLHAQRHGSGRIEVLALPESGTVTGQNTRLAVIVGGIAGMAGGAIAGSFELILGLDAGLGAALGALTGALVGLLCGMMAGNRQALPMLRAASHRTEEHEMLVTVEVRDRDEARVAMEVLERAGARETGST